MTVLAPILIFAIAFGLGLLIAAIYLGAGSAREAYRAGLLVGHESRLCRECRHFERCSELIQVEAAQTVCDWDPSRWAPREWPDDDVAPAPPAAGGAS